jgi:hypothetical protein
MVQVDEQALRRGPRIGQAGRGRDVAKLAPTHIPEQGPAPGGRDVQVEASVVVVIAKGRRDGAIPERDPGPRRGFDEPAAVAPEQTTRDIQVLGLVVVVITRG